jgi:glycosyltransferase involved in cell wall biosynthesis
MKQKLLLVITKSNWGGAQKYVYDIATSQAVQTKYDVSVAVGQKGELVTKLLENNIEVHSLKKIHNSLNLFKLVSSIIELITVIKKVQPDVIHTNSSFAGISVGVAGALLRKKMVFTVHGWPFNERRTTQEKLILKTALFFVVSLHTKIICVSRAALSQLPATLRMRSKAKVVHNGIINQKYTEFGTLYPEFKKTGIRLVTIAELHSSKNHMLIIEALDSLPKEFVEKHDISYHIIGEGSEHKKLKNRIEKSLHKKRIYMYGAVPNASKFLPSFDIFVLSSITEAFGYVILEAGLAGVPVISTRVGGIPEIIKDDVQGVLVRSKDIKGMAAAIQDMCIHKTKRIKYAAALKTRVQKEFTTEKMIEETMKIYSKV